MLEAEFFIKTEKNEQINICGITCVHCTNVFFVPNIGENEPSFCAYCGIKFIEYKFKDNVYTMSGLKK